MKQLVIRVGEKTNTVLEDFHYLQDYATLRLYALPVGHDE